ncbi:MAG: hypothetical protein Q4D57_03445 [Clostridia bacterium]|nr:hypothetical protein [Clostridia bacterium]
MENNSEKIKEFFSDKSKVRELTNDETFIEKVSGGTATPETYREKFKSLGLELTTEDAEEISKDVKALLNATPEELEDISLENICGGSRAGDIVGAVGTITIFTSLAAGLACGISSEVYRRKYKKMLAINDTEKAAKYQKLTKNLGNSFIAILAAGGTVGGGLGIAGTIMNKKQ